MLRMGTDSLSVLLRLCRLLNPSSISRRSTRSSTRDWEIPKSSKVCGMGGLNPLWAGESVAAMKDVEPHSPHRPNRDIYLQGLPTDLVLAPVRHVARHPRASS